LVDAFEGACGKAIARQIVGRRPGDLPEYYAQADYAKVTLGWQAQHTVDRMCVDNWRWQSQNPNGFN